MDTVSHRHLLSPSFSFGRFDLALGRTTNRLKTRDRVKAAPRTEKTICVQAKLRASAMELLKRRTSRRIVSKVQDHRGLLARTILLTTDGKMSSGAQRGIGQGIVKKKGGKVF